MYTIIILCCVVIYCFVGAIINGIMHRYDPQTFDPSKTGRVVLGWIILVPLYWFCIFCDRCIYWFSKKEK